MASPTGNLIDGDRLWRNLMALGELTDPNRPFTRRCFTEQFLTGRRWLAERFEAAGLSVQVDAGGNLIGRREGSDPGLRTLAIGSHSDTVPSGGRFDGPLGVVAGLEVAETLREQDITLRHPLEIIDFLSEEPSEYGLSCVGSRAMTGHLTPAMLELTNAGGETLSDAMARMGARPAERLPDGRRDIAAFLELHVEQARFLEDRGLDIGIVTGIAGILRLEIVFTGSPDHAGTTPYDLRRDALLAAAGTVLAVRSLGEELADARDGFFVATTGVLAVAPNAANVVPGSARLVVEARAEHVASFARFTDRLSEASLAAAASAGVERSTFRPLSRSEPAHCDPRLRAHLDAGATDLGLSRTAMASGAGHDSAFMATIAPTAMIFVPSQEGRSHCPEEWTEPADCVQGAALLMDTLMRLDWDDAFSG